NMEKFIDDMNEHALAAARDAHEKNFSSRRGAGEFGDHTGKTIGFYIYDNNPWDDGSIGGDRDRIYDALVKAMDARGCREVGRAHYPTMGEEAGYTFAAIYVSADPANASADMDAARAAVVAAVQDIDSGTDRSRNQHTLN